MTIAAADPFWARVRDLFQDAVELEGDARKALLDACDDARVRDEVQSLLDAHEGRGEFMAVSLWEMIDNDRHEDLAGTTIGAYRLERPLGEGGMGTVFLAVRNDEQFERRVAIKLIRGGRAAESIVRRFRQERQILAALEHPNIARLLDGGTTADGLPYLVMEYVDGTPIDRYVAANHLSIHDRLRLFLTLCDAVQYAHRNLIIHRDLKPANVLITNEGTPKLLDFGIAKLTSQTAPISATQTRMMTPAYASPEQLRGDPVSTASDVYSLGVLLFELLTGSSPFDETRVADTEPVRAGTRVPALRGDLDTILLMAMDVDPARRYGSVEQFADDVRRHLSGHLVLARRATVGYRAAKFVRRHRLALAAMAVIVTVTAIAFVATLQQKRIAERRFDQVRTLARAFVFEIHDAIAPLPGSTPARELLVSRALVYLDNLAREAADNPSLQMELASAYLKIGDVQGLPYQPNLGDTAGALTSYRKAIAITHEVHDSEPELREATALLARAHDRYGLAEQRALRWVEAMREHRQALALRQQLPSPTVPEQLELARTWVSIGDCLYIGANRIPMQWRTTTAQNAYESALKVLDGIPNEGTSRAGRLEELARAHQRLGGYFSHARQVAQFGDRCVRHQNAAMEALAERLAMEPTSARARRNLADQRVMKATAQLALHDAAGALAGTKQAIEELHVLLAADPTNVEGQHDVAFALHTSGEAYLMLKRWDEARDAYGQALAIFERLSRNDPSNRESQRGQARTYSLMSVMYERQGDTKKAKEMAERSTKLLVGL